MAARRPGEKLMFMSHAHRFNKEQTPLRLMGGGRLNL
jgi:hypothetical protein